MIFPSNAFSIKRKIARRDFSHAVKGLAIG
jgi:hypothetical protein